VRVRPAAPEEVPRVFYRNPLDHLVGRYTAEWDGPDGVNHYQTIGRVKDWEGNWEINRSIVLSGQR
jgi:hypothetical protein